MRLPAAVTSAATAGGVPLALAGLARLLVVLLSLEVGEDSGLLNLPFETAEDALEIVPFIDGNLDHYLPFIFQGHIRCE